MKIIRPTSTSNGTMKIGFKTAAATTASSTARAARRQFRASKTAHRAALAGGPVVV